MPAGAYHCRIVCNRSQISGASESRAELARLLNQFLSIRRDRNDDCRETIGNELLPDHPAPCRLIFGVGSPDCSRCAGLVRMPIFFVLPGFASFQREFPLKIRKAFNGFSLLPGKLEIDVLKLVVEADLTGI